MFANLMCIMSLRDDANGAWIPRVRIRYTYAYDWSITLSHSFLVMLVHNADGLRGFVLFFSICRAVNCD